MTQADASELPTGYYFVTLDSPQVSHTEPHLQAQPVLKSTANVVLKTTATEAMIWVHQLGNGRPLAQYSRHPLHQTVYPDF